MKLKKIANLTPSIVFLLFLFLIWEVFASTHQINSSLLPAPSQIFAALFSNWSIIAPHVAQTVLETLIGFIIATILGVTVALLLDLSPWIRRTLYLPLVTSQTIPMIALAPLLLVWFGFDLLPKVIMVVLFCFFPIAIATSDGLANTDPDLLKLLKSMNASYEQTLRMVRIPNALPQFFSGLKIAITYSVTGAIVGEYVGGYLGLGIYMQTVANSHTLVLVFSGVLLAALLSLMLFTIVVVIEKISLPWYKGK